MRGSIMYISVVLSVPSISLSLTNDRKDLSWLLPLKNISVQELPPYRGGGVGKIEWTFELCCYVGTWCQLQCLPWQAGPRPTGQTKSSSEVPYDKNISGYNVMELSFCGPNMYRRSRNGLDQCDSNSSACAPCTVDFRGSLKPCLSGSGLGRNYLRKWFKCKWLTRICKK